MSQHQQNTQHGLISEHHVDNSRFKVQLQLNAHGFQATAKLQISEPCSESQASEGRQRKVCTTSYFWRKGSRRWNPSSIKKQGEQKGHPLPGQWTVLRLLTHTQPCAKDLRKTEPTDQTQHICIIQTLSSSSQVVVSCLRNLCF